MGAPGPASPATGMDELRAMGLRGLIRRSGLLTKEVARAEGEEGVNLEKVTWSWLWLRRCGDAGVSIRLGVEAADAGLDDGRAVAGLGNESSVEASVESATALWLALLAEGESLPTLVVVVVAVAAVVVAAALVAVSDDSDDDDDVADRAVA